MIKRCLIAAFLLVLLTAVSSAQSLGLGLGIPKSVPSAGGCSQATTFLARTSGLSGTQTTAYQNLICGMVTDGTWSLMDLLYVFATNTTATANLNLVSTSYGLTPVGTETFAANAGYTGDGTTGYFTTGYNPATNGINFTQNSAGIGACGLSSANFGNYASLGLLDGSGSFQGIVLFPSNGGGSFVAQLNDATLQSFTNFQSKGSYVATRTASTAINMYVNGASVATPADTSSSVFSLPIYVGAVNTGGGGVDGFSINQLAYVFVSGGLTSTQVGNVYSRLHTFLVAVGAPSGC